MTVKLWVLILTKNYGFNKNNLEECYIPFFNDSYNMEIALSEVINQINKEISIKKNDQNNIGCDSWTILLNINSYPYYMGKYKSNIGIYNYPVDGDNIDMTKTKNESMLSMILNGLQSQGYLKIIKDTCHGYTLSIKKTNGCLASSKSAIIWGISYRFSGL